ncbi:amidohydrolase family protein [Herbiconiux sp. VKM Ac-1786]|uniref:metal-dependent hydrolase family protein n=1 Tax=Herbiconiux sp. VKM Ac-1786 TaxID=2783824 RepID=UPI00188C1325|nr:amidohydrolase family protein [Herbiconiux sp. VKM Ac-1786]MBF4571575.1 amidohydrolase family protein [Herbiconiux sp. VKM Ac-1786]
MNHSLTAELWDGTAARGTVTLDWTVDGTDGTISGLRPLGDGGTASARPEPGGVDGSLPAGYSIIPGLVDTHVHLVGHAGPGTADFLTWPLTTRPEEQTLHGLANARAALRGGVTTLRDLSADDIQFSLRRALEQGVVEGPRLQAHGMVSMTAGHGDLFTPPAFPLRKPVADGPDECRKLVRHWARAGADGIKIATSGGVLSVGDKSAWRNYTDAEIDAIVDEAHALGLRVAAHAHTEAGIDAAVSHGVDSIEHGTLLNAGQSGRIAALGITVAPTLLINDRIAAGRNGVSPEQADKAAALVVERDSRMREAAELGVDFVLGTDANGHHVDFGDQMEEVRLMAATFGWTPARALEAATSRAARAIGEEGRLGVLAPGAAADFLVMEGRPWEELEELDTSRIVAVVSRGRVVAGALPGA